MQLLSLASYSTATHLHRCVLPFRHLRKDAPQHQWKLATTGNPKDEFDALWLYGARAFTDWIEVANQKRLGKRFIWTMDDTLWNHPDWRSDPPEREHIASVNLACELADLIVASTPALAAEINKPLKTVIGPNLLEVGAYGLPKPPVDDGPIRILWSGSNTHSADLDLIDGACCRLMEKYGSRIEMYFVGAAPDGLLQTYWNRGIQFIQWVPLKLYWETINQIRPHIVLAPLTDCIFNQCKSGIRLLEGWSINAAVVVSPVGEYGIINSEVDGLYANNEDEWVEQLSRLIEDRQLREHIAVNGYRRVLSDWNWANSNSRQKWSSALAAIDGLAN